MSPNPRGLLYITTIFHYCRYSTKSFSYTLPLHGEGKYLLVLKFCEVFFEEANKKVFDVILNDIHVAIADLDIFREVGHATAHDEHIPFTVSRSKLFVKEGVSEVRNGRLKVSFVKNLDNPKINGIVLVKGADVNEFPQLPPKTKGSHSTAPSSPPSARGVPQPQLAPQPPPFTSQLVGDDLLRGDEEDDEVVVVEEDRRERRTSGPRHPDPYYSMDSAMITILFIVTATLIPIVILRCRL